MITYSYAGGKYDRAERDFYGYATVTYAPGRPGQPGDDPAPVDQHLPTSFYTKGLLERADAWTTARAACSPRPINQYDSMRRRRRRGPRWPRGLHRHALPAPAATDQRFYEGQRSDAANPTPARARYPLTSTTRWATSPQYVDAGDAGAADDVTATIGYASCPATYVIGTPNKIIVTAGGAEVRHREARCQLRDRQRDPGAPVPGERQRGGDRPGVLNQRQPAEGRPGRRTAERASATRSSTRTTRCPVARTSPA